MKSPSRTTQGIFSCAATTSSCTKENALNLLIARLPTRMRIRSPLWMLTSLSLRPDWAQETLHLLEHYKVLQMFSHSLDLGPDGEPLAHHESFVMHELNHFPHNPMAKDDDLKYAALKPRSKSLA